MSAGLAAAQDYSTRELLIATIADLLDGVRHVAVGASSPIPAAGAMLLRARNEQSGRERVRISILGSQAHNFFTNGGVEVFDCAAQGRIDAFFLGGGQIDGQANINLVGTGAYPMNDVRWPGCFGSSFLYFLVPRVILFREEHSRRVLVEKVDYISAPGTSAGVTRRGGPYALLTDKALFSFDRGRARFALRSVHRGTSADDVRANTGFDYDTPGGAPPTTVPDAATLELLRGRVTDELSETYPQFAQTLRSV
jgi:glutaconate CoA-transferase subunit B